MIENDIVGKPLTREATFDRATANVETKTVELSFSSEAPYERYWGTEILSHDKGAADLARLNGGANVLVNHDPGDWVGVIENARVDEDKKGRATVRFGSSDRAKEIWGDVQDGILKSVSVGYRIDEMKLTKTGSKGAPDEYTVTKWTPYEVSLVTVPADATVGVGRSIETAESATGNKGSDMHDEKAAAGQSVEQQQTRSASVSVGEDFARSEATRKDQIKYICERADIPGQQAAKWILEGVPVEEAQRRAMEVLAERHKDIKNSAANVGLSSKEVGQYSLFRMIEAVANKNPEKAGLEFEAHRAIQQRLNRLPNDQSFYLPSDKACYLRALGPNDRDESRTVYVPAEILKRDLTSGTAAAGGYLVETGNQGFIELLRNNSLTMSMGATRLAGLIGNLTIPKQTAPATPYWLTTEATAITESQQTLGQLALSPKNVGAYTEISRQLLLQSSPSAEAMIMSDLARVVALAVDAAALEGSGAAGQPTGISNTAGIGSVTGTTLGYAGILEFQTDLLTANVRGGRKGYATTPAVAGLLAGRQRFSSTDTPLWEGNLEMGTVAGYPGMSSNQLTAATAVFGDWSQLVVAEWGVLEIEVNPYANFQAGIRGVRAMYTVDVGLRWAAAFSRATTIT